LRASEKTYGFFMSIIPSGPQLKLFYGWLS
jgi:hypothetical protein